MSYTNAQIRIAARAFYEKITADVECAAPWEELRPQVRLNHIDAMSAALSITSPGDSECCTTTADPTLLTWMRGDGLSLADALAGLPPGHPITLTRTVLGEIVDLDGSWRALDSEVASASWLPAATPPPAWDGALLLDVHEDDLVAWRTADGLYSVGAEEMDAFTPAELATTYDTITVLINANFEHVRADRA